MASVKIRKCFREINGSEVLSTQVQMFEKVKPGLSWIFSSPLCFLLKQVSFFKPVEPLNGRKQTIHTDSESSKKLVNIT